MSERTWETFLSFLYELPSELRPGRQRIGTVRDNLQALVEKKIRPELTANDEEQLFPLGYSPAESDLKIAAGVGLERRLITPDEYEQALRTDKERSPFGFLQTVSGKTFGEYVAPRIAQYWLAEPGDRFVKVSNRELYDFSWTPNGVGQTIRIEMKASSEEEPNFQQIRHPRMISAEPSVYDYDVLLCLGVSNEGVEWWVFPADVVESFIDDDVFTPQHGGRKTSSGTFWIRMRQNNRERSRERSTNSEMLRGFVMSISAARS